MEKNILITAGTFVMTFAVLALCFSDTAESKDKVKKPIVFTDSGMIVSNESRTYNITVEPNIEVSYKASGEGNKGNLDCAAYNQKSIQVGIDNSTDNSCDITFNSGAGGNYHLVIRNNSEGIQRFAASAIY